jgi:hypothetical protein
MADNNGVPVGGVAEPKIPLKIGYTCGIDTAHHHATEVEALACRLAATETKVRELEKFCIKMERKHWTLELFIDQLARGRR